MAEQAESLLRELLQGAELFSELPGAALEDIASHFRPHRYSALEVLFLEGQPASEFHLIGRGKVKITQTSQDGEEVIMHVAEAGELIGALPTLEDGTYPAGAAALNDVLSFGVGAQAFEAILLRHPLVARRLLRFATRQLQIAHRRLRELATERVERRIARALTRLAGQLGEQQGHSIEIAAPLSRQDLAEMCGTTLYTVSRTLKEWQRLGLVQTHRKKITILDPHGLVTIAEDLPPTQSSN